MEGNGVRAVIMGLLILGLVVAQIEAKSCCRNTTGRNCYNVCRVPGTPRPVCANACGCKIISGTTCPSTHPRSASGSDMDEDLVNDFFYLIQFTCFNSYISPEQSVYQTIITTTELDEEPNRPSQSERCRRQLSGTRFDSCMRYLQQYIMLYPTNRPEEGQQCCEELRQVNDPQCRCEALEQVVQQVPGYGQQQQQVAMKAQQLADQCGMQELGSCQIRGQQEY